MLEMWSDKIIVGFACGGHDGIVAQRTRRILRLDSLVVTEAVAEFTVGCGQEFAALAGVWGNRRLLFAMLLATIGVTCSASEGVILLHGLCRTERSMAKMESALEAEGYVVLNVDYPSRRAGIEELAETTISAALANRKLANVEKVHFVTHSMGGILARHYLQTTKIDRMGRVVMLGPPNQGSEVIDKLGDVELFRRIIGPAGNQLGTGSGSAPHRLGAVNFELGVIAGDRSINWINSAMIDGPDDGKVSVERTRVVGMKDHLVLHTTHAYLMRSTGAIREAIQFLREGNFSSTDCNRDKACARVGLSPTLRPASLAQATVRDGT